MLKPVFPVQLGSGWTDDPKHPSPTSTTRLPSEQAWLHPSDKAGSKIKDNPEGHRHMALSALAGSIDLGGPEDQGLELEPFSRSPGRLCLLESLPPPLLQAKSPIA